MAAWSALFIDFTIYFEPMKTELKNDIDHILQAIELDVIDGRIRPGMRLDERVLSERFGVSRTPIREALLRLSHQGTVEIRRNKGAFVSELTSARLLAMLEVLSELKVFAAGLSARRMTLEDRQKLEALSEQMTAHAESGNLKNYFDHANSVHDAIFKGTHNAYLVESARNIQACMCGYRRYLSQIMHMPLRTSLEENRNIVSAIMRGDAAEAAHWMRKQTELRREEFSDLMVMLAENAVPRELKVA